MHRLGILLSSIKLHFVMHFSFSYLEFKIRLIRVGFYPKSKIPVFKLQPTDSQSGVITITPKSQL